MLYWAQNQGALVTGLPWWSIAPGLCVALLGAALALVNYAFDEISNPALRPVRRHRVNAPILEVRDLSVEYQTAARGLTCRRPLTSTCSAASSSASSANPAAASRPCCSPSPGC
jgi:hypothetical protein